MANPNWKKGHSGNPAGRPKGSGNHVERCRIWAEKTGWNKLEQMTKCGDPKIEIEATKLLLAYGCGKPTEHREISGNLSLETLLAESIA